MKESEIQKTIIAWLEWNKFFHYRQNTGAFKRDDHFYRFGDVGAPDIVCVIDGIYLGIEVKTAKGKQSPAQKDFQRRLEKAGGKYILAYSLEDVIKNL